MMLSDVCLSRTSKTERPRKTKIGTEVARVTRDSDTNLRSKGQRARTPRRSVNASGSCSGERGNVLAVETYGYVAVCRRGGLGGARRFGANRGRRGAGAYCGGPMPTTCLKCVL